MHKYDSKNKKFISVSVIELLNNPQYRSVVNISKSTRYRIVNKPKVVDGRVVSFTAKELVNRVAEMSRYKVSDFYLENLINVGALNGATQVSLQATGVHAVDNALLSVSKIQKS